MDRPITTLFMLMSVDGKITTGISDILDFDKDFPNIPELRVGLHQYYAIEQTTDLWSLNSGRTQAKAGVNKYTYEPDKTDINFVLIDDTHLNKKGIEYFCKKSDKFVLITNNPNHAAFNIKSNNMSIIYSEKSPDFMAESLIKLKKQYGCDKITVQTGGTLNGLLLRKKLIDYVDIVVAPVLVGGKGVSTLIDGEPIASVSGLVNLGLLKLQDVEKLADSYIRLKYKVLNN